MELVVYDMEVTELFSFKITGTNFKASTMFYFFSLQKKLLSRKFLNLGTLQGICKSMESAHAEDKQKVWSHTGMAFVVHYIQKFQLSGKIDWS